MSVLHQIKQFGFETKVGHSSPYQESSVEKKKRYDAELIHCVYRLYVRGKPTGHQILFYLSKYIGTLKALKLNQANENCLSIRKKK